MKFLILAQVIYFLLPVYFSNMSAVASAKVFKRWNTPILSDNVRFRGKPVLGKNKTWRGLFFGVIIGLIVYYLQSRFVTGLEIHEDYGFLLGFLLAFGAVLGDAVESFVKRQLSIKPGEKFIPWDQIDHPLMALFLASFVVDISWEFFFVGVFVTFFLHVLINFISYSLKMRDTLW